MAIEQVYISNIYTSSAFLYAMQNKVPDVHRVCPFITYLATLTIFPKKIEELLTKNIRESVRRFYFMITGATFAAFAAAMSAIFCSFSARIFLRYLKRTTKSNSTRSLVIIRKPWTRSPFRI